MERERFIRIPKNEKAMRDYDFGVQKKEQMEEMILSDEQYRNLCSTEVFDKINEKCDIIIDDYEDEILELDKIPIALEVINQLFLSNLNEELIHLKRMLDLAICYKTIVGFDF